MKYKKNRVVLFFFITFLISLFISNYTSGKEKSFLKPIENTLEIKAKEKTIIINLYGYTSPLSVVTLETERFIISTLSYKNGYFVFESIRIPENSKELCLSTVDTEGRVSLPNCIPFEEKNQKINIGPVIMPPTITSEIKFLNKKHIIIYNGQTIPNHTVLLHFFADRSKSFILIKNAFSYSIPKLSTMSSADKGKYSFSVTINDPQKIRAFSNVNYKNTKSPKSNTLIFQLNPWWLDAIQFIFKALKGLKDKILFLLFLSESIILLKYLLKKKLESESYVISKNYLIKKENNPIILFKKAT